MRDPRQSAESQSRSTKCIWAIAQGKCGLSCRLQIWGRPDPQINVPNSRGDGRTLELGVMEEGMWEKC
jgi:hypothetical protein